MKRLFSLLLCLILCLGMLPAAWADEAAEEIQDPAASQHAFVPGYVEPDVDVQYPAPASSAQSDRAVPSSYSSKWVSPVKDQASNGLCWDFTACALMETNLLKSGYGTYDLSELHMGYAMSNHSGNSYGENRAPYDGGNREIASAYFMRGMPLNSSGQALCVGGFVSESNDPYNPNQLPDRSTSETFTGKPKYVMPKDSIFLSGAKDNNDISEEELKGIVQSYGAVGASMYWDYSAYNDSTSAFYLDWNPGSTNHAVTIVGWDDNYSRYNFASTPGRNGAWLIKNSWGDWWGDDGYFWISYDDPVFPSYAWTVDGVIKYDSSTMQTYEYDYTPYDYWWNFNDSDVLYARFFDADKTGAVSSVQVFLPMADSSVQVDVIPNVNKTNMDSYAFQSRASRKCHYAGWYTVDLSSPVTVEKGARFAVIVKTDKTVGVDSDSNNVNSGFRWSASGGEWDYSNYAEGWCIKAVVRKSNLSAPTITSATGKTSSGKPTLKWKAVSGASKYAVYRAGSSNGTYTKLYTTTSTSYTNTSAKAGYTYYYKVCAVDSSGAVGPASASVGVHCRPAKPAITSATGKTSSGKPTLKWKAVDGAAKYVVYRAGSSNGTYTKMYTTTKTSYTNTSAKAGYTYYYKVYAVDSKGYWSVASSSVGVRCRIAKPTITSATGKTSSGKPTLKWKAVDGAVKYVVYRSGSSNGTYTKMYTTASTSYTNTSAKVGYTYYYKVYAVDSKGYWSAASTAIGVHCRPAAPTFTSKTTSSGKPTLKWKAVDGASKYVIYRSGSSNGTYTKMYTTTSTSYTNTSAKAGYTYYYKVYAVDSKGYASAASAVAGIKATK